MILNVADKVVKILEEIVYFVAYLILLAWQYRWLVATTVFLGTMYFYALYVYGMKTNF